MSQKRSHEQTNGMPAELQASRKDQSKRNRRKLLKGAAALPVIMTLHSGSALARTSNLVGQADPADELAKMNLNDNRGERVICLHPDPSKSEQELNGSAPPYDLGNTPTGHLEHSLDSSNQPINELEQVANCQNHGGIVISASAYTSIMNKSGVTIDTTW